MENKIAIGVVLLIIVILMSAYAKKEDQDEKLLDMCANGIQRACE